LLLFAVMMILILVVYYYYGLIKKEYAGNFLNFSLVSIEAVTNPYKKQNTIFALMPYISNMNKVIDENPGYWKPIYKLFHIQASLLLIQGRPWDAAEKLKKALRFHVYYAAAYKMLGNIKSLIGLDKGKDACYRVHQDIFQSKEPISQDIEACLKF